MLHQISDWGKSTDIGNMIQRRITLNFYNLENDNIFLHEWSRKRTCSIVWIFFFYNMHNSNKMVSCTFCIIRGHKHISSV
jgi:hypothetical protein